MVFGCFRGCFRCSNVAGGIRMVWKCFWFIFEVDYMLNSLGFGLMMFQMRFGLVFGLLGKVFDSFVKVKCGCCFEHVVM